MADASQQQFFTAITRKIIIVSTLIISSLAILNTFTLPVELRFERIEYNYLFVIWLSLLLPLSMLLTSFVLKNRANRFIAGVISVLIALPSLIVFMFAWSDYEDIQKNGVDDSFEKIAELGHDGSKYRLYRTNGGATTSYGLMLREEVKLVAGLNLVNMLAYEYPARDGMISMVNGDKIKLIVKPYQNGQRTRIVELDLE